MNFFLLVAANTISTAGSSVFLIAILLWLKSATDSAAVLGLLQFSALLPSAIFALVGGAVADRFSRKGILVIVDSARGVVLVAVGVLLVLGILEASVARIIAAAVLVGLGNAFFQPAVLGLLPDLVATNRLSAANGTRATATQAANVGGTAAGGFLAAFAGIGVLFLVNGASFLAAGVLESFIGTPRSGGGAPAFRERDGEGRVSGILDGFCHVRADRSSAASLLSYAGLIVLLPPVVLAVPFAVSANAEMSDIWIGIILSQLLLGGIVGFLVHGTTRISLLAVRGQIAVGYLTMFAALLIFSAAIERSLIVLFVLAALLGGAAIGWTYVAAIGNLQRRSPAALRSRVLALGEALTGIVTPFVYLASGVLLETARTRLEMLFVAIAAAILVFLLLLVRIARPVRLDGGA